MYFSKDTDSVPPPSNHPGSTGDGPWHRIDITILKKKKIVEGITLLISKVTKICGNEDEWLWSNTDI